jgi:hypothetical protein
VLVETVGIPAVWVSRTGQRESGFGGEDVMTQALRGIDECGVGGKQQGVTRYGHGGGRTAGLISGDED